MNKSTCLRHFVAAVAIFAVSVTGIALADQADEMKSSSEDVAYADLDVTREADAYALFRRLQQAAEAVCGVESLRNARTLREFSQMHQCYKQALATAVEELDNDTIAELQ